jgi:hypothetical protein
MGLDPLSLAASATQIGMGAFQSLFSGRKKAQNQLENQANNSPIYSGSKPINDYYQEALNRYNVSPYNSQQYQIAKKNAQAGTATGLGALQDRRSALGGVGKLVGIQDQSLDNAGVQAERQKAANFGQLGSAATMKNSDDRFKFSNNVLDPYQRKLQLSMMKASAANARSDAGTQNVFGGLTNAAMLGSGLKNQPKDLANLPAINRPTLPLSMQKAQQDSNAYPTFP